MTRYPEEFKQILNGMRNAQYQNIDGVAQVQGETVFDFNVLDTEYRAILDSSDWCG